MYFPSRSTRALISLTAMALAVTACTGSGQGAERPSTALTSDRRTAMDEAKAGGRLLSLIRDSFAILAKD